MKTWGITVYIALLIERVSRAFQPQPAPMPAQFRNLEATRQRLRLEQPYHAARGEQGYVFIAKDTYFEQSEEVLRKATGQ